MNKWMDDFINHCLKDIPHGRYRRRVEAELRDHMEMLRQDMREAEVLCAMGDPERLRKEYYIAWKQTPLCRVNWIISGGFVIWTLILMSISLSSILAALLNVSEPLASNGLVMSIIQYWIPFPLGALFLRACFREERRRAWWVTLGLLVPWVSYNWCMIVLMIGFEEIDQYYEQTLWLSKLQSRIPWLTPYLCLSFLGCLALGWLFGRKTERSRELA